MNNNDYISYLPPTRTFPNGVPLWFAEMVIGVDNTDVGKQFFKALNDIILKRNIISLDLENKTHLDNASIMLEGQRNLVNIIDAIVTNGIK